MKVTDKRMFTPEGELRQDPSHVKSSAAADVPPEKSDAAAESAQRVSADEKSPDLSVEDKEDKTERAARRDPKTEGSYRSPSFLDLVTLLAEPIALYLGEVSLPDGKSAQDLELARLHIDLLDILQQKSAGNLSSEETSLLNDVLYRSRMRYVQEKG